MIEEHFLRQFCDAHTCTGSNKPFPKGGKVRSVTPSQLLMFAKCSFVTYFLDQMCFHLLRLPCDNANESISCPFNISVVW